MPRTRRAYPSDANVPHCSEPHDRSSPIRYPVPDTLGQRMQFDRLMRRERRGDGLAARRTCATDSSASDWLSHRQVARCRRALQDSVPQGVERNRLVAPPGGACDVNAGSLESTRAGLPGQIAARGEFSRLDDTVADRIDCRRRARLPERILAGKFSPVAGP
jgi:hypothetical protein